MKRVYLDQMKWIDLTAARKQLAAGRRFEPALTIAQAGVERRLASFPLSDIHYIELSNRADWTSRRDVAVTMAAISRFHTIAPAQALLPSEIDRGLRQVLGVRVRPRRAQAFGFGVSHAFANSDLAYQVPDDAPLDPTTKIAFQRAANKAMEWALLVGPPRELEAKIPNFDRSGLREPGELFAAEKERLREIRRAYGNYRGKHAEAVAHAQAFADYNKPLSEGLEHAGLDWNDVLALGRDGMTALLQAIPMIFVDSELHRLRDTAAQQPWTPNDLNDLSALTRAIVYCDVVVTERQWTSLIQRAHLDEHYNTLVTADLAQLPALLA